MKIIDINVMKGPNYWSIRRQKLIVMQLDLEDLEERPTNTIEGFSKRLEHLLPSLYEHRCSEGHFGGFFSRVKDGTWMGHVVEHIALELQTLSGMECNFGQTRGAGKAGVYFVVFEYQVEETGVYAAKLAVRVAESLISATSINIEAELSVLKDLKKINALGPSTGSIVEEAEKRGIPFKRLNRGSLVRLGYGVNQKIIQAALTNCTSGIAIEIASDKDLTKLLLERGGIPVPMGFSVSDLLELDAAVEAIDFPLVIKPLDGNQGKGASINVLTKEETITAFDIAKKISETVIVERYISGFDYRLLIVNNKMVAAAKRTPASVTGNGKSTIRELIEEVNKDPRRGDEHENTLTTIKVDEGTINILQKQNLSLESILGEGQTIHLKSTANLSTGGTAEDVTDLVHPEVRRMAERASRIIGLDICGIDIMSKDISQPIQQSGTTIIEVNASPGLRMLIAPSEGKARNVAKPIVDMLFPQDSTGRIPIIAITGTNGKTTTTRLISHIAKTAGYNVGMTTTDGVYIGDEMIEKGDCTGPLSSEQVLSDKSVDFAVLECARGGILRSGLAFSSCDVGVVTNVGTDHLGLKGIDTIEKMAKVKATIAESVNEDGFAILNADDDLVYQMRKKVKGKVALFSLNKDSDRIWMHTLDGGIAATIEDGHITIIHEMKGYKVEKVDNIPLSFGGKAACMIQNILAATLAAYTRRIDLQEIRKGLISFVPSAETTPGRMNLFEFERFKVMVDYAHNPEGFLAIGQYLFKLEDAPKVGIITGVGDRRDEDLIELGRVAAVIFDEIIIRLDKDLRGRTPDEIFSLLISGIKKYDSRKRFTTIKDESEAIDFAIVNAIPGSFITILCESVSGSIERVKMHLELEKSEKVDSIEQEKSMAEKVLLEEVKVDKSEPLKFWEWKV